jgi:hypothetical protein
MDFIVTLRAVRSGMCLATYRFLLKDILDNLMTA